MCRSRGARTRNGANVIVFLLDARDPPSVRWWSRRLKSGVNQQHLGSDGALLCQEVDRTRACDGTRTLGKVVVDRVGLMHEVRPLPVTISRLGFRPLSTIIHHSSGAVENPHASKDPRREHPKFLRIKKIPGIYIHGTARTAKNSEISIHSER